MAEIIRIPDGNAFLLRVTGQIRTGDYTEDADFSVVTHMGVNFVRRGRIAQTFGLDSLGRIVIENSGNLAQGVYGVELYGYYHGEPWRNYQKNVFQIVNENANSDPGSDNENVLTYDVTFDVTFGGDGISAAFVEATVATHNGDQESHSDIREELDEKVSDVKVGDTSIVVDGVAVIDLSGKQDVIQDLSSIRSGAAAGGTAYQKPGTGIPASDLSSEVQDMIENGGKTKSVSVNGGTPVTPDANGLVDLTIEQANVTIGTVSTGPAGSNAEVHNSGTGTAPVLDFVIPQGQTGQTGPQGPMGESVIVGQGDLPLTHVLGQSTEKAMSQKGVTDELEKTNVVLYGEDDPTFSITKGYYNLSDGIVRGYANLNTRVKINTVETLLKGSYHLKLNDGYVIRQILICDANNENGSELVSSSQLLTEYTFIPSDDNVIYSAITICKTNASSSISTDEDIIDVLEHPNQGLIHEVEVLEEKINEIPTIYRSIKKAVFMGDSITHGVYSYFNGGVVDDANRYNGFDINNLNSVTEATNYHGIPYYFAKYAGCEYVNLGKRGSGYVYDGRDIGNALEVAENYDFSDVDFVALCFGINDWIQGVIIGDINTLESDTLMGNMVAVLTKIFTDNPLCKVVVYSPYNSWGQYSNGGDYTSHTTYGSESTNYALGYNIRNKGTLQDYVDAIDAVCQHYGVQHVALSKSNVVNRFTIKNIMIDGLHPSKASYPMLAAEIYGKGNYGV
jgi:lysophospholipase L1-like esterase